MRASPPPPGRRAALAAAGLAALAGPARAQQPQPETVLIGREGWLFSRWDRTDRLEQGMVRDVMRLLAEATAVFKRAGIEIAILLLPSKWRIYRRFLPEGTRIIPEVERRYGALLGDLRGGGMLVPDLATPFREAASRDPHWPLFFKTDTHWTPVGAELAAVRLATEMLAQLRLPPSPRPGTALGEVRMMRLAVGDLVQYVPQAQRGAYGPEESPIREVAASGAAGLLEDDVSDVQVVGTSNVQPRFGFQPVFSNQIMRPVGLAWRPNNLGPYFAMMEYLRSGEFRRQRPRAIVWNHQEADMGNLPDNAAWRRTNISAQSFLEDLRRALA